MGEVRILKNIVKLFICIIFLSAVTIMPNVTLAAEKAQPAGVSPVADKKVTTDKKAVAEKKDVADKKVSDTKKDSSADKKAIHKKLFKNDKVQKAEKPEQDVTTLKSGVVLTIDDCVSLALKNDPNIKNAIATQKVQKSSVGIAKSGYFPNLVGGTGYNINNTQYSNDRTDSLTNNYYGLNLGINQLIWDFGYTTAKINMSKYNYEAASYDLETVILGTSYTAKIAYTAVLAARANVDIDARSVRINELNVERTRAMYQVGLKSKIDVVNAEVYLTDAKVALIDAQNNYQTSLITLNNSMYFVNAPDYAIKDTETFNFQKNYSVKNEIDIAYDRKNYDAGSVDAEVKDGAILTSGIEKRDILRTYKFKPFDYSMAEAIQKAYDNRPDLKSLELVKRASEESLKAVKRSYFPSINASGNYAYSARSDYGANAVGIYAGINFPTINAMQIKCLIEKGTSNLDIASNNIDLLKKNMYFSVQNYYVNMKKLEKTIPLMSKKVQETLENFELADGRYAVGLGDYLELQQAQTNYNNAQLAFVQSVFDYNKSRFYLEKAMGLK